MDRIKLSMKIFTYIIILCFRSSAQEFWTKTNAPTGTPYIIESLAANSSGHIFAGASGIGIYRTTNNGSSWELCFSVSQSGSSFMVNNIVFDSNENIFATVYGGEVSGIYFSQNNGNSWNRLESTAGWSLWSLDIDLNDNIFVNVSDNIVKSTDRGISWTTCYSNTGIVRDIKSIGYRIYAGIVNGKLIRSNDEGNNWEILSNGLPGGTIKSIVINSTNEIIIGYYGIYGIFKSVDDGNSFYEINNGITDKRIYGIACNSNDIIFAGTPSGCYASVDNGNEWNLLNNGFENTGSISKFIYSIITTDNDYIFAGMNGYSIYRSSYQTSSIILLKSLQSGENWLAGTTKAINWVSRGIQDVKLEFSTDNGFTWIMIVGSYQASSGSYSWTIPNVSSTQCKIRIIDANNENIVAVSENVFTIVQSPLEIISPNGGETWQVGSTQNITWSSENIENVKIEYSTNNGSNWNTITLLTENDGNYEWLVPNTTSIDCKVKVSDVNNESIYDVSDNSFAISNQHFMEQISIPLTGVSSSSAAWGDYDNDDDLDLIILGHDNDSNLITKIYRNDNSIFTDIDTFLPGIEDGHAEWGDYDNDGDLDIVITGRGNGYTTKIYRNDKGNFVDMNSSLLGLGFGSAAWGDYDNDGDLDILVTGTPDGTISSVAKIYRNDGGNFIDNQISLSGIQSGDANWIDYDNDDDLDLFIIGMENITTQGIAKLYNNSNGYFILVNTIITGVNFSSSDWGDYDGDGDMDLLICGGEFDPITKLYRNNNGNFEDRFVQITGVRDGDLAWGDYDNDGDLDVIISGNTGASTSLTKLYKNNAGNFSATSETFSNVWLSSLAWGDYDNDGDLDIILTGRDGENRIARIFKNNTGSPNIIPNTPSGLTASVSNNDVILRWNKSTDDKTPQNGLTYNLRLGTSPNGNEIVSSMSNPNSGFRAIPKSGNTGSNSSWAIKNLPNGTYYWSVQAIDNSFAGSQFTEEQSFTIGGQLTLTVPNGGEKWQVNSTWPIIWNGENIEAVKIEYSYNGGVVWNSVIENTENDGIYEWIIPDTPSEECLVRISDAVDGDPSDTSEGLFEISEIATIRIISPDGGENWEVDSQHQITWESRNIENVVIEYTFDNGITWHNITVTSGNDSTYNWIIPDTPSETCLVRISDAEDYNPDDISDDYFIINPVTDIEQTNELPTEYSLSQNYPNPFNPITSIMYNLPEESSIQIVVYNNLGEKIVVLQNEIKEAGYYRIEWNGENLTSGIYYVKMTAISLKSGKKFIASKKTVLLK